MEVNIEGYMQFLENELATLDKDLLDAKECGSDKWEIGVTWRRQGIIHAYNMFVINFKLENKLL